MRHVYLDRLLIIVWYWLPLLSYCLFGAIKKLPPNPDWMEKDTKVKAFMCTMMVGIMFPAMLLVAALGNDIVWSLPPFWHMIAVILTVVTALAYLILFPVKYFLRDKRDRVLERFMVGNNSEEANKKLDFYLNIRWFIQLFLFVTAVIVTYFAYKNGA